MGQILKPYQPKKRYIPKHIKHEENLQRQVCSYLRIKYPNVLFKSDYSAGLHLTIYQAKLQKSLMSGRGWPDLMILQPSRGYHGLFIELKKDGTRLYLTTGLNKGKLTTDPHIQEQALMLKQLNKLGYFARFGVGFDNCQRLIDGYLNPNYKRTTNVELF